MSARYGGRLALSIWSLIFRIACLAFVIDGVSKYGLFGPKAGPVGDFQPSPLGPFSPLIEIVAGACVVAGFRCRSAALMLAGHLVLGNLITSGDVSTFPSDNWAVNIILLTFLLAAGPGQFSVDHYRRE